jgi:UDP-glucose 4-epimerase
MRVLVTGGAGYIGSHTSVELIKSGFEIVIVDNFINSSKKCIDKISDITKTKIKYHDCDLREKKQLEEIFNMYKFDCIIHFAGLKAVGQSVVDPMKYYDYNVVSAINLIDVALKKNVNNFIFSSSATVYGAEARFPYIETMKLGTPTSPYGATKATIENILGDLSKNIDNFSAVSLRYFNPIGAHVSGLIGENPMGIPDNLLPFISQVAVGKLEYLNVFGDDYPTEDGTCKRDYIHVSDLANGHIAALKWLIKKKRLKYMEVFNLGTGNPISVFEIIRAFEKVTGKKISFKVASRRDGDLPQFWADASKAEKNLKWKAVYDLNKMIEDTWNWQLNNPNGYG